MRANEVFTPGKLPEITYIDEHLQERANILSDALDMGAAVVSLSGPSKSGKTVFIEKNIGKGRLIQVTGAGVTSASQLWDRVFDIIGTPTGKQTSKTTGLEANVGGKLAGGVEFIASASSELSASGTWSHGDTQQEAFSIDYLNLLIRELSGTGLVVFIDDFHYIPRDAQTEISNQIKEAIRNNVIFVVATVPYHSDDAIRANSDLRGRIVKLDFDYWKPEELKKIALRGFSALNCGASDAFNEAIASEAAGSPQLMQALCLNACYDNDIREQQDVYRELASNLTSVKNICVRTALMADYTSTVEKMKEGPKTRGQDRKAYVLIDGTASDVYPLIVKAIAQNPPELTIRYPNLQRRIQELCVGDLPSGSSVTGACSHISIIANDSENRTVIEWDGENDVLDIRDPYLLFFLRWG